MLRCIFLAILMSIMSGCIVTKTGAYRVFAEDLERLSGQSVSDAYVYNIGYIANLTPEGVKSLANGNEIKTYVVKPPRKQDCTVHIEIGKNNIIVVATSEGPECWRSY